MMEQLSEQRRHHIGIIVPDMDQARAELLRLYGDLPGLDFVYEFRPDTVWTEGVPSKSRWFCASVCWNGWMEREWNYCSRLKECTMNMLPFYSVQAAASTMWPYNVPGEYPQYRAFLLEQWAKILFESETEDDRGYRRCCYLKLPGNGLVVEVAEPPKPHVDR